MRLERGNRRPETANRAERGSTLVAVIAIVSAALLIGSALFMLGASEADLVEYGVDSAKAFYLAEGAHERAQTWLEELVQQNPSVYPTSGGVKDEGFGGGDYDAFVTRMTGPYPWLAEYDVVSTACVDGVTRQVHAVLREETFAQYMYYSDRSGRAWFTTGDSLDGRVHTNGHIRIAGDPWFGMKVTSARDRMIIFGGSDPTFEAGYELGVEEIPFPTPADVASTLSAEALAGGIHGGPLAGHRARYEVELGRHGRPGYVSYRSFQRVGHHYQWSPWTRVRIRDTNGVAWFEEPIEIKGTLDGTLTIGSAADIHITDDVIYEGSTPGFGPDPGCDDILGLISGEDIIVDMTLANMRDVEIHAHMMTLDTSFTVEQYWRGPPRGDLIVHGGVAQQRTGSVGVFSHWGIIHGYNKNYHFDPSLSTNSPPSYPATEQYVLVSWREVVPPRP